MEEKKKRFRRLLDGRHTETQGSILNGLANGHVVAVRRLVEVVEGEPQVYEPPLLLTIHAVIQTVAEQFFGKSGESGKRFYLERFVDEVSPGVKLRSES